MPEPALVFEPAPSDGPVLVSATYRVTEQDIDSFLAAMRYLRQHNDRLTASEQANLDRVLALADTETHKVDHLFATRVQPRRRRATRA